MSCGFDINVDYCVIELIPRKLDRKPDSVSFKSSIFIFQSSECRLKISYGWESNERNICKLSFENPSSLLSRFYITAFVFKGNHSVSYPKKAVLDPSKFIWTTSFADIEKKIPGAERWNVNFRFIFQTEYEPNHTRKSSGHKLVQTSSHISENYSLQRLSDDFARLLNGDARDNYYDIEVECGDRVIRANKAILITRSEYFRRKLPSLTKNKIQLSNIDPAAFDEIMQHIYRGKTPDLSWELAKNIYKAGDVCNTELRERCIEFLTENLRLDNACECLAFADDDSFKERVIKFIIREGIPYLDEYWMPFCQEHPKSALDVCNKFLRLLPRKP